MQIIGVSTLAADLVTVVLMSFDTALRPDQHEWQFSNPLSSVARKNYRPGMLHCPLIQLLLSISHRSLRAP